MCLLIVKTPDGHIDRESLIHANMSNPDGVGYSYVNTKKNKIITRKFRKFSKFLKGYYRDLDKFGEKSSFLIHFRLSTHGETSGIINVHPFKVNNNMVFAHNGVIDNVPDDEFLSDTQVFNKKILQRLPGGFLESIPIRELIKSYIGFSKLAFLDSSGNHDIIGENLGHWADGVWYSNHSYKESIYMGGYPAITGAYGCEIKNPNHTAFNNKANEPINYCEWCGIDTPHLSMVEMQEEYITEDGPSRTLFMCWVCGKEHEKEIPVDRDSNVIVMSHNKFEERNDSRGVYGS